MKFSIYLGATAVCFMFFDCITTMLRWFDSEDIVIKQAEKIDVHYFLFLNFGFYCNVKLMDKYSFKRHKKILTK